MHPVVAREILSTVLGGVDLTSYDFDGPLPENLPRVFPEGLRPVLRKRSWPQTPAIAHVLAAAGIETRLFDVADAAVQSGLAKVRANLDKGVAVTVEIIEALAEARVLAD